MQNARRYLPHLILLFIGSGCAALIYEIVWFQILELVIGSSSIALGVLLSTFMGGMCAGSLLAPRLISRTHHPLRVYAMLELGIAVLALLILVGVPAVGHVYAGLLGAICLVPPTLLMGATLPAISRWVEATPEGVSWLGLFYGGNIGGAVLGCLLAGFYLLRVYDIAIATFVAVVINVAVAVLGLIIAKTTPYEASNEPAAKTLPDTGSVYATIALSGFTALSAEVIWTRLLSLLFGATVYTFSLILSVFLLGLGIGSSLGSYIARNTTKPRVVLGWCQMLLCGAMAWAAFVLLKSLPWWPINVTLNTDPWIKVQLDVVRALWVVLPAAILWGASFPLALASIASRRDDPGKLVGGVYAANTLGAIAGSLLSSLVLVSSFGVQRSLQAFIAISAVSGLLMLTAPDFSQSIFRRGAALLAAMVFTGVLFVSVPALSGDFVAYGRFVPTTAGESDVIYVGEGKMAFVAVSKRSDGSLRYHSAGKVQASSDPADMRLQRMLGHLTTLIPESPKNLLVIGFGSGVTAGAVSLEPRLERETVIEIEPLVPQFVASHFSNYNFDVSNNEKVTIKIDDGRHFLMTTDQKFDGITSDPLDPWFKGSAALYSREFFEAARAHLNPGGVVTQWMQLYQTNEEAVKSEIATFFEVFPFGSIWANNIDGRGYDLVLLGQAEPTKIDIDELARRVDSPEYQAVARSLREIKFDSSTELLATFAGQAADFRPWLKDAAINSDRNLRLQYLAGFGLNLYRENEIYRSMVAYGPRMPKELFTGSQPSLEALARLIESGRFR